MGFLNHGIDEWLDEIGSTYWWKGFFWGVIVTLIVMGVIIMVAG